MGHELKKDLRQVGEMSLKELSLWSAFYTHHDPHRREQWQAARMMALIANLLSEEGGFSAKDFMPPGPEDLKPMDEDEMERNLAIWMSGKN